MIKIARRTKTGWSEKTNNTSKTHCDACGEKLWVSPGNERYCNGNFEACQSTDKK